MQNKIKKVIQKLMPGVIFVIFAFTVFGINLSVNGLSFQSASAVTLTSITLNDTTFVDGMTVNVVSFPADITLQIITDIPSTCEVAMDDANSGSLVPLTASGDGLTHTITGQFTAALAQAPHTLYGGCTGNDSSTSYTAEGATFNVVDNVDPNISLAKFTSDGIDYLVSPATIAGPISPATTVDVLLTVVTDEPTLCRGNVTANEFAPVQYMFVDTVTPALSHTLNFIGWSAGDNASTVITCTDESDNNSTERAMVFSINPGLTAGICGTNATNSPYAINADVPVNWATSYCSSGVNDSTPAFPSYGAIASWICLGDSSELDVNCSASREAVPAGAGACGSANNVATSTVPALNLCYADGIASTPTGGGTTAWTWTCAGTGDGSVANCSAPLRADCGSNADNSPYVFNATQPANWTVSSSWCAVGGMATAPPSFPNQGNTVSWTCAGSDSSGDVSCSASRSAIVAPVASPVAGTYTSTQSVSLISATSGATIYYTIDGTTPTSSSTQYSSAISVSFNQTIKAIAIKDGISSDVISVTYIINIAGTVNAPTANPAGGTYDSTQTVTLTSTTSGASIYYTTDGISNPNILSTLYTGPITISQDTTIRAAAIKSGMLNSGIITQSYVIWYAQQVATPLANPVAGTYTTAQSVSLTSATSGATIYYTIDGTTPTNSSSIYSEPISVSSGKTIKAIAVKAGMANSEIFSANYIIDANSGSESDEGGRNKYHKKYMHYRGLYRNEISKSIYFELREMRKNNPDLFYKWKEIFFRHKHDSRNEINALDGKTSAIYWKYKNYNGYRNYKIYKLKSSKENDRQQK